VRHDLGVDVGLADAAGDELRILRAEVDNENGVIYLFRHTAILAHPADRLNRRWARARRPPLSDATGGGHGAYLRVGMPRLRAAGAPAGTAGAFGATGAMSR